MPNIKWTETALTKEALKYQSKITFKKGSNGAYQAAHKRGLISQICVHMEPKWTYEKINQAASQHKTIKELRANNNAAYKAAYRRGLIDDVCSHMNRLTTNWTYEMILNEANKYTSRSEFSINSNAYQMAAKRGILDDVCSHMEPQSISWTEDMILDEAITFDSRSEFKRMSPLAYVAAQRRGVLDKACNHMDFKYKTWSDEEILQEAKKYQTRSEFRVGSSAYGVAVTRGVLDEVCSHMKYTERVNWTPEMLAKEALKYSTRAEFYRTNNNAYCAARRLEILDKITEHLGYLSTYNTRDMVYIWHAENDIFKVGITSENLGDRRIYDVARDAGFEPKIVILESIGTEGAIKIEKQILKLGNPVFFKQKFAGSSEFRHFTQDELGKAIEIIKTR
jgi:hypothetical protein